jgi:tellurium resistance protein TerD
MSIKLEKGMKIDLRKGSDILANVQCNLLWKVDDKHSIDVDVSCIGVAIDASGVESLYSEEYFIFYNNLKSGDDAILHTGDERVQGGESVIINLTKVPVGVMNIAMFITIDKANKKRQHFGLVDSATCQIVNEKTSEMIAEYDLKEDFNGMTAVHVGSFYRADGDGDWEFKALGAGMVADLGEILSHYGVNP